MLDDKLLALAADIVREGTAKGLKVASVESCTGGMVAGAITEIAGSSSVLDRAFVTYATAAKVEMVGVRQETVDRFHVVSKEVAAEMAAGAIRHSPADIAVSITGVAGPGGGDAERPVGTVCFGLAVRNRASERGTVADLYASQSPTTRTERAVFPGDRSAVRRAAVERALILVLEAIRQA